MFSNTKASIFAVDGCHDRIFIWLLDLNIYMKVLDGISVLNENIGRNMYCVKLNKSLDDLKLSGRMWYNRLKKFILY
jgi:hypothetical protein